MLIALVALGATCVVLLGLLIYERYQAALREDAWRLERTGLLQRIQAPELAVAEHGERPERKPAKVVSPEDDASFREIKEARLNGS